MWKYVILVGGVALLTVSGCGGGIEEGPIAGEAPASQQELDKPASTADLKAKLSAIADSGVGGSALSGVQPAIDDLKSSDAKLAESLSKDLAALSQLTDPARIKSAAKKMADKL